MAGLTRDEARPVTLASGVPAYGGTPSDASVIRLIEELKQVPISIQIPDPDLIVEQWLVETYLKSWSDWRPVMFE